MNPEINKIKKETEKELYEFVDQIIAAGEMKDIKEYYDFFMSSSISDEWYENFIDYRIDSKCGKITGEPQIYENCNEEHIIFLKNDREFRGFFKEFLENWQRLDFLSYVVREIYEKSRVAHKDYELGKPMLENSIRVSNNKIISDMDKTHSEKYTFIDNFFKQVINENKKQSFNDYYLENTTRGGKKKRKTGRFRTGTKRKTGRFRTGTKRRKRKKTKKRKIKRKIK